MKGKFNIELALLGGVNPPKRCKAFSSYRELTKALFPRRDIDTVHLENPDMRKIPIEQRRLLEQLAESTGLSEEALMTAMRRQVGPIEFDHEGAVTLNFYLWLEESIRFPAVQGWPRVAFFPGQEEEMIERRAIPEMFLYCAEQSALREALPLALKETLERTANHLGERVVLTDFSGDTTLSRMFKQQEPPLLLSVCFLEVPQKIHPTIRHYQMVRILRGDFVGEPRRKLA